MRKNLGVKSAIFPMPVLMVATYDENGIVNVMNAAWGMMVESNIVVLNLSASHKTVKNILKKKAFTVGIADSAHVVEADYLGIASGNNTSDKFAKTGLTAVKSEFVDAPIIDEFPVTMECKFIEYQQGEYGCGVIGEIVNVSALDKVLDEKGEIEPTKINAILFDTFKAGYYTIGEKVGNAFSDGKKLK